MRQISDKQKNDFMAGYLEERERLQGFLKKMEGELVAAIYKLNSYVASASDSDLKLGVIEKLTGEIAQIKQLLESSNSVLPVQNNGAATTNTTHNLVFINSSVSHESVQPAAQPAAAQPAAAQPAAPQPAAPQASVVDRNDFTITGNTEKELKAQGSKYARQLMGIDDKATLAYAVNGESQVGIKTNSLAHEINKKSLSAQTTLKDASKTSVVKKAGFSSFFSDAADRIKSSAQSFWQNHRKKIIVGTLIGLTALGIACCCIPGAQAAIPFIAKAHMGLATAYHAASTAVVAQAPVALAYVKAHHTSAAVAGGVTAVLAGALGLYRKGKAAVEEVKMDSQFRNK